MHPAGIFGNIAANRTGDLAGRIGGVIEPLVFDRARDAKVGDTGLHHCRPVVPIDIQHAVEFHHTNRNRIGHWQSPARKTGARTARHNADFMCMTIFQNGCDLPGIFGQDHNHRQLPIGHQTIAFIGPELILIDNHTTGGRNNILHGGNDILATCKRVLIRLRHPKHRWFTPLVRSASPCCRPVYRQARGWLPPCRPFPRELRFPFSWPQASTSRHRP